MRQYRNGIWIYRVTEILARSILKTTVEELEIMSEIAFGVISDQLPKLAEVVPVGNWTSSKMQIYGYIQCCSAIWVSSEVDRVNKLKP